ncbi:hypothetical protein, partial [Rhodovulum sulfidophilum]|uniref:hypothetical protein n=1 Tax=Rhodovulum sulfidophilum TaxID=35806 RepID=UPI0013897C6F
MNQLTEAQAKDAFSEVYGAVTGQILAAAIDARMGAVGASVNEAAWHPHDMVRVGDGADGLFWDHSAEGDGRYISTPDFEDGYEYMIRFEGLTFGGNGGSYLMLKGWVE